MTRIDLPQYVVHLAALIVLGLAVPTLLMARPAPPEVDFVYYTQPRDTLIGLGKRLLVQPDRWRELQARNKILDSRRIPSGTRIRIPYAWLNMTPETAAVTSVTGAVSHDGKAILPGEMLAEGSVIATGTDGAITLTLADGSVMTLQRASVINLEQMRSINRVEAAHSIRLQLESGRVESVVKPHRDVGRFEIRTPIAISAVRGTKFRTGFNNDNATTETLEGSVDVATSIAAELIPAGFGTRVVRDAPPLPQVPLLPPPGVLVPELNGDKLLGVELQPVSGATAYRVQLAADAAFHALLFDKQSTALTISVADLADGTYWLRARAIDAYGIEGTDIVKRIVQHALPVPPAPMTPLAAAKLVGATTSFEWTPVEPDVRYRLQIADDAGFASVVIDRDQIEATRLSIDALLVGKHYWRVASVNSQGERGNWSAVNAYSQQPLPPLTDAPAIQLNQLRFSWEPQVGATYRIQVARDPRFEQIFVDEILDAPGLTMHKPLPGTYYVRVQAIDADGDSGLFGAERKFIVPLPGWAKWVLPLFLLVPLTL